MRSDYRPNAERLARSLELLRRVNAERLSCGDVFLGSDNEYALQAHDEKCKPPREAKR